MVPDFGSSCTSMDALRSIYLARDQKTRGGGGQPAPPGRLKNAPVGVGANPHSGDWLKPGSPPIAPFGALGEEGRPAAHGAIRDETRLNQTIESKLES